MNILGERLKRLRKSKSLTQVQMAKEFNLSERQYQNYEIGVSKPSYDVLLLLADFFNVSIDYLVGRSDDCFLMPRFLFEDDKYRKLSSEAKLAYTMMLENYSNDESSLDKKLNESFMVSIKHFTNEIKSMLQISDKKADEVIKELSALSLIDE